MLEIQAPKSIPDKGFFLFLAGSIEMGKAIRWQDMVKDLLKDFNIIILNPRRDDWDSSWIQSISDPPFYEQVVWELNALEKADKILMYFDPNTKSPISLLELGLHAKSKKLIVLCPEGYWRKGNVDIVCKYYKIPQIETFNQIKEILGGEMGED